MESNFRIVFLGFMAVMIHFNFYETDRVFGQVNFLY